MIKIPNYNVVVPVTPDLQYITKRRLDFTGERAELSYTITVSETLFVRLPWVPIASEWVEVYINGVRLINPRISDAIGGSLFEVYNIIDNNGIKFSTPISGDLKIICDTKDKPWYGAVVIDPKNIQSATEYKNLYNFNFFNWPVSGGSINGLNYRVFYDPGPIFEANSYVIVSDCEPDNFNGNFQVVNSTADTVTYRGNIAAPSGTSMSTPGIISGFGNGIVKNTKGISLYSEPVIITQPHLGYARLTADRKSIAYVPNYNYVGNDSFSWALINQHGQIGDPKCVNITIRDRV
jgi:hypothetical protein